MEAYRTLKALADHGARLELYKRDPDPWNDPMGPSCLLIRIRVAVEGVEYGAEELVVPRDRRTVGQLVENCVRRLPDGAFPEK
jgi:hypothetical protein